MYTNYTTQLYSSVAEKSFGKRKMMTCGYNIYKCLFVKTSVGIKTTAFTFDTKLT